MNRYAGKASVKLIIVIAILAVVGFFGYKLAVGRNGIITKVTKDEEKYNKSEILEEINLLITEKYLNVYSKATATGENKIEEFYNDEKVIAYLKGYSGGEDGTINYEEAPDSTIYIEDLVDEEGCYYVKIENLKQDFITYGKGENVEDSNDYFFIKKVDDKYNLYYKNVNSEIEEIGELQMEPSI
jgi:hypothetical protein